MCDDLSTTVSLSPLKDIMCISKMSSVQDLKGFQEADMLFTTCQKQHKYPKLEL